MKPIANSIAATADELTAWRRDFHQHPELGYHEQRTAATVAERLNGFGLDEVATGIGGTGVLGVLHGATGAGGESIMLRADMDALPIDEATGLDHASRSPGTMHACGHDGHMTMLLGAARRLAESRAFDGTVYFCFQPAEEGGAGAKAMLEDGLFERFRPRAVYGLHNWPGLPAGTMGVREGPVMAAGDAFEIRLTGKGGHGAEPQNARDPIVAGAQIVTALQSIVARRVNPQQAAVLSVTSFRAGNAHNVIPGEAVLGGTCRCFDDALYARMVEEMDAISRAIAGAMGIGIEIWRREGYPTVVNDGAEADFVESVMQDVVGEGAVIRDHAPSMASEDFSYFSREVPGAFAVIGNGDSAPLHHPEYDFNDEIAPVGVAYWTRLVERALPA